ncbi:putative tRNA pseudouridine synthase D protein [Marine Group I thaumarchaeote SCGC AAA799-E16]|uniref:Putative tRNA pseudouridine synthase D protein n=5 Tax=Marine Group I TaxID=905826 RepID=A0A087S6H6_9ARCH|nr:putative tRNA pseudouridine synthase D protein [Marine Group I thaumarchaeote SCGC AAA799-N04]KER06152.1 putative tRNA pseudouridine synthase D protein [Marine Group I thaumarchaeote SCGC AAA799-E16]KFM15888.1 putative tRNA pseudouridine synthase D protein [Marine Group I thaumarchaeote SCGC AAA799-D11]KFM17453.1 putative tRNA pseudouridine synthase D protein [Marine Group I thaumarchaeote SCGC RSA3]KFM21330.1 putative tRNA pseudouridine synthase D protein [Marine Group I thaumarchaeote SCGC
MIPDLDSQIGISVYSTKFDGIGGKIRVTPEDFEVSEKILEKTQNSINQEEGYAVYKLKKKKIDTNHTLSDIFRKKGIKLKSLGLKDASAITEQFVCSGNKGKAIEDYSTEKYSLKKIGFVKKPLSKKDMIGNHFKIKISECSDGLSSFTEFENVLNFYGYQRFGSKRPVTHLIGKAILQRNFDSAVELILSFTSDYDSKENNEIRQKLADKQNYQQYFEKMPKQMDIERIVLKEMIEHGDSFRAVRAIPLSLRRFYVQAYQSFIFNKSLSAAFSDGENMFEAESGDICFDQKGIIGKFIKGLDQNLALPFVGYSYYKKTRFDYQISQILQQEEVTPKDFFIKEMQEVSSEGGFRQVAIDCSDYLSFDNVVEFTLSRGSFATILLREIMKPSDPIHAGF